MTEVVDASPMPQTRDQAIQILSGLPQVRAGLVPTERIQKWLDYVERVEPSRIAWHARRAYGIGGSEIGTLIKGFRGEYDPFSSPADIVMGKLLLIGPDGGSGHTRRGTALEDTIRGMFREKYRARGCEDLIKAMGGVRDPELPWLVGNPDDVVEIEINGVPEIFVVDYKSPTPRTLDGYRKAEGVEFGYSAQLHQMTMLAERAMAQIPRYAGRRVFGQLLCCMDLVAWDVDVRQVEFDAEMFEAIVDAGNYYWNGFVMQGKVPEIVGQKVFDIEKIPDDTRKMLAELAARLVSVETMIKVGYDLKDALVQQVGMVTSRWALGNGVINLPLVKVKAETELVPDEIAKLSCRHGIEVDQTNAESLVTALRALEQMSCDVSRCVREVHVPKLSRARADLAVIDDAKAKARIQLSATIDDHSAEVYREAAALQEAMATAAAAKAAAKTKKPPAP